MRHLVLVVVVGGVGVYCRGGAVGEGMVLVMPLAPQTTYVWYLVSAGMTRFYFLRCVLFRMYT